jgi:hypothetical protein
VVEGLSRRGGTSAEESGRVPRSSSFALKSDILSRVGPWEVKGQNTKILKTRTICRFFSALRPIIIVREPL